jgi:glycosyltransferase involved in cell wall biosynthesis
MTGSHPIFRPLVSIVTVVFNNREGIEKTIRSVIGQTYSDIEYIIIDGGSKDGTLDVIKKYESKIAFWISEKDKGIYDAMNKGLRAAKGDFVLFLNSGDLIADETVIEKVIQSANHADCYYGETLLMNGEGEILGTRTELTTRKLPENLTWKDMINGMVVSHQSILFRKAVVSEYDLNYRCSADIKWVIEGLKRSERVVNAKMVISKYLIGGFSIANQKIGWKERFEIYVGYYGLARTIIAHLKIVFRNLVFRLKGKKNY